MIQDILPYKLNNQFVKDVLPSENDKVMIFSNGQIMAHLEAGSVAFPTVKISSENGVGTENLIYLFSISDETGNKESYFLYEKTDVQLQDMNLQISARFVIQKWTLCTKLWP